MVKSMTGFGSAALEIGGRSATVELKSVNHRFFDPAFRMPRHLSFTEEPLRAMLSTRLSRGHVDIYLQYANRRNDAKSVQVDMPLLMAYQGVIGNMASETGLLNDFSISHAARLPDVLTLVEEPDDKEAVTALVLGAAERAVEELIGMRFREGEKLRADVAGRVCRLDEIAAEIAALAGTVVDEYRDKLKKRIETLLGDVALDEARLAQEVAYYADKASIDEELVRLKSHTEQFRSALDSSEPSGRRLDFIVQEMNREINTIGSKAANAAIQKAVLSGKAELEKIREQVQNIE